MRPAINRALKFVKEKKIFFYDFAASWMERLREERIRSGQG
jgi:hypothetical protein